MAGRSYVPDVIGVGGWSILSPMVLKVVFPSQADSATLKANDVIADSVNLFIFREICLSFFILCELSQHEL